MKTLETPPHIAHLINLLSSGKPRFHFNGIEVEPTERFKSLNRKPSTRDLSALQKLEATRRHKDTIFQPESLRTHKTIRYLKVKQVATNEVLKADLFDNIVKMKEIGNTIQAIGYNNGVPTVLILEK